MWKKQGGGKAIEVDKADIVGVTWMKVPRTNQLGVRIKDGLYYKFTGFRDQVNWVIALEFSRMIYFMSIYWEYFDKCSRNIHCLWRVSHLSCFPILHLMAFNESLNFESCMLA